MSEIIPKIHCNFATKNALYSGYMPFLRDGGLFIRTNNLLPLGTKVSLCITLLSEAESYTIEAKVAWITPMGAQSNKPVGLGFQFLGDKSRQFRNKVETNLSGMLKSVHVNDTM